MNTTIKNQGIVTQIIGPIVDVLFKDGVPNLTYALLIKKEDGTKLHKTEVVVGQLIFLSKREDFETTEGAHIAPEEFDDFSDLEEKF